MWAQLITLSVKDGTAEDISRLLAHLHAIEQPDSGWIRTTAMRDQADPHRVLVLAVFESEERARARESDPRRADGLETLRGMMSDIVEGPPQFFDLDVIESTP